MAAADDPLWYKDAVIYQVHVRGFFDSNDDGVGRLPGPDAPAGLHSVARRQHAVAAAVLPVAVARRRLRHRALRRRAQELRHAEGLQDVPRRGARTRTSASSPSSSSITPRTSIPWFQAARRAQARDEQAQFLRVERLRPEVRRRAHHLQRHRAVELGVGPGGESVLLAPLLPASAGSQFRQPIGTEGRRAGDALLAGPGRRRDAARCRAVPDRARRHVVREPARDP